MNIVAGYPLGQMEPIVLHADARMAKPSERWEDRGCSWHPACLRCPELVCRYDTPNPARK